MTCDVILAAGWVHFEALLTQRCDLLITYRTFNHAMQFAYSILRLTSESHIVAKTRCFLNTFAAKMHDPERSEATYLHLNIHMSKHMMDLLCGQDYMELA